MVVLPPLSIILFQLMVYLSLWCAPGGLFRQAISRKDHYGARYSLGLTMKLYPSLANDTIDGYTHMCRSLQSFRHKLQVPTSTSTSSYNRYSPSSVAPGCIVI